MSEPFATSDMLVRAREWLDAAAPRWRLQTMQHRAVYNPRTGEYRQLPTRVRRFLNGTPSGIKAAVLQVLRESAPYSGAVFDMESAGCSYAPTATFIRRDGPELVSGSRDATYTIVQDLRLFDSLGDRFAVGDESSCSRASESEWRWDEPDVEPCPDGSQGVSYQVTDVSRDRETDLFGYRVRKVTALTQHVPPHVARCDARSTTTVESWDNLYGQPGSLRMDPLKGADALVSLPDPCRQPDGTTVQVSLSENADCTFRAEVVTTVARLDEGRFSVYRDQYRARSSDTAFNAPAPLDRAGVEQYRYAADDGQLRARTVKYESERSPDGTWTNSVSFDEERPVLLSRKSVRVTARSTTVRSTDSNVPGPPDAPSAPGRSVEWERTPGGLYVVTTEAVSPRTGALARECSADAFLHRHADTAVRSSPKDPHVPSGAGRNGRYYEREQRRGDDGLWEVRDVVADETEDVDDGVDVSVTARGRRRTVRTRQAGRKPAEPGSDAAGRSVSCRLTRGGLWDVESTSFDPRQGPSAKARERDAFLKTSSDTSLSSSAPSGAYPEGGSGGLYGERVSRLGDDGLWETTEVVHRELPVSGDVDVTVTARGLRRVDVTRNTSDSGTVPGADDAGRTFRRTTTRGGLHVLEVGSFVPRTGPAGGSFASDAFQCSAGTLTLAASAPGGVPATVDSTGVWRERRFRLGDDGVWDDDYTEHHEIAVPRQRVEERVTPLGLVRRVTDLQVVSEGTPLTASAGDVGKERVVERTRGGRRNVTTVEVAAITGETGAGCQEDAFQHVHSGTASARQPGAGANSHVARPAAGRFTEVVSRMNELGLWDTTTTETQETDRTWKARDYEDAFGTSRVEDETSVLAEAGTKGGAGYSAGAEIRSVESQMTRGCNFHVKTTTERPTAVSSGHLHFHKSTDKGLTVYHDFIVFRNQDLAWVNDELQWIQDIDYTGGEGSYANHPSVSISPNRFGLWDGTIALQTTFTPKEWAPGGNGSDDNFEEEYTVKDVSVSVLSAGSTPGAVRLLKAVTTEKHLRGGGVGRDKLTAKLSSGVVRGSQFSYHPGGQSFQYDLVTSREVRYSVVQATDTVSV